MVLAWRKRRELLKRKPLLMVFLAVMAFASSVGLSGCGSGSNYYNYPTLTTPVGTTVFTLTGTSSNGATESIQITMIVGASQ
jgi:hypothetical protein